jgi:isopenicillin-N N-acyltransferase like protein
MRHLGGRRLLVTLAVGLVLHCTGGPRVHGCTLWGAVGTSTLHQGTLVAKNRDWEPDHIQSLKVVHPREGFRYVGLFAELGKQPGLKAGINDQGLAVVNATAGSIPRETREAQSDTAGVIRTLLTTFTSVDDALNRKELFARCHAVFLILSDKTKIAVVEIGLNGAFSIQTQEAGTVHHTNHYCAASMLRFNQIRGESSLVRYARIQQLLSAKPSPYTLDDFRQMSTDQNSGPDNSIWRLGSTPTKTRTLATWITEIPKEGAPTLYLKIANPAEPTQEQRLTLDPAFWSAARPQ